MRKKIIGYLCWGINITIFEWGIYSNQIFGPWLKLYKRWTNLINSLVKLWGKLGYEKKHYYTGQYIKISASINKHFTSFVCNKLKNESCVSK